jgi:RNA polymerase sigma factor (sigma-70 family)
MKTVPKSHRVSSKPGRLGRRYVVAMVLGTALSAVGGQATAATTTVQAPHQVIADMSRYCTACWRNAHLPADYWSDCTQDVFRRLLGRVHSGAWQLALEGDGDEHREFLRAIDAVKKHTQRGLKRSTLLNGVVADMRTEPERELVENRAEVDHAAAELLSPRQQRILQLSFEGWSVHEIAGQLELAPERISDEKYKAIRKLREHFGVVV